VCGIEIAEHLFDHQFCMAVGVDGCLFVIFRDRYLFWLTIGGAGAGEDEVVDSVVTHDFQQGQAAGDVVTVILARVVYGFTDIGVGCEVHNGGWLVLFYYFVESGSIKDITLFEGAPFYCRFMAIQN